ncbi:hypothetical protein BDQ17DRAFT_1434741 [Cyathus striatus]|nr:hypothetical protein BDQ17DRAFT_1434741 [Cyathus striatus]
MSSEYSSSSESSSYSASSTSPLLSSHFSSTSVSPPPKGYSNDFSDNNQFVASPSQCSFPSPTSSAVWSSREPSENASSDDDDGSSTGSGGSESTLDDDETQLKFGYPLERIPRHDDVLYEDLPSPGFEIEPYYYNASHWEPENSYHTRLNLRSHSPLSVESSTADDGIDYDAIIEMMLLSADNPFTDTYAGEYISVTPAPIVLTHSHSPSPSSSRSASPSSNINHPQSPPKLMIKRIPRSSQEYSILLNLNQHDLRMDPWNPAPHLRSAIERESVVDHNYFDTRDDDGWVFLCMETLRPYDKPPLEKIGMWVDFFRQVLEGLIFLHEHDITLHTLSRSTTYMISSLAPFSYLSSLSFSPRSPGLRPPAPSRMSTLSNVFDRASYPVRYYLADFSKAEYHPPQSHSPFSPTTPKHKSKLKRSHTVDVDVNNHQPPRDPFKRDVFELGKFFERRWPRFLL